MPNVACVWFKRDLRLTDHQPLVRAINSHDKVILVYILEPELWQQPDMSSRQFKFLSESIQELQQDLNNYNVSLSIRIGDALNVFQQLLSENNFDAVYSHQETWNMWTYKRDIDVKKFLKSNRIQWIESQSNGVVRSLRDRNRWSSRWHAFMHTDVIKRPITIKALSVRSDLWPSAREFGLRLDGCTEGVIGGRTEALSKLRSFLHERGEYYTKDMSSPLAGSSSCSRLSPYIAFGCLSVREVYQSAMKRKSEVVRLSKEHQGRWPSALSSFLSRLRWHCHFIQKIEDEPQIELKHMHSAYDNVRTEDLDNVRLLAWQQGKTGFPMVDACMRYLHKHGWINFRMRAMLMSFASYHLWLDWRHTAPYLASQFIDYEPGIHYSQVQMQSGTTGINTIRIYNPVKQGVDQDPKGLFIKKWVPELQGLSADEVHMPWLCGKDLNYPAPIVDEKSARLSAQQQLYGLRKSHDHRYEAAKVVKKHASRKRKRSKQQDNGGQRDLFD